jgi:hypothetical protein
MDDTLKALSQKTPEGGTQTLYTINQDFLEENMEIRYGRDHVLGEQPKSSPPIGSIKFRFISSKMHLILHGRAFEMKRRSPMGGHFFQYPTRDRVEEMQWKSSTFMGSDLKLLDCRGRTIACTKRKRGGESIGFHIVQEINDGLLMDLIVVTGVAAVEYRRQSDQDWNWLEDIFG